MSSKSNEEKDSSPEENISPHFKKKAHQIFLNMEEKPETIIEKILINLFNQYINPEYAFTEYSELQIQQNKVKLLCSKIQKSKIVYILLFKIRYLIKKYKEKLFELPNIIELRAKLLRNKRSSSHDDKIVSKCYINFLVEKTSYLRHSYPKIKKFNYYAVIKNLIRELKNIRNCLKITAPIIEKIFEEALAEFDKFSIWECEKEDYLKILILDNFIWKQICVCNDPSFQEVISQITEDHEKNLIAMTYKINYFKYIDEYKKNNLDEILKINQPASSIDSRYPEDAKPICSLRDEFFRSIISEDKDIKYSFEEDDIEEYTISEEQNIDDINNLKKIKINKI